MTLISFCPKLATPKKITQIELSEVLNSIKNTDSILLKSVRDGQTEKKLLLPCIIFAGTFSERNKKSLIDSSEYMILDFDKIEEPQFFRDNIFNTHPFVKASFLSPTGTGVKVLVRIPKVKTEAQYVEIFNQLNNIFPQLDQSGKDLARVCFMSYDPDIKIRHDETVFIKIENTVKRTVEMTENEIIDKLLKWFHKKYSLAEGNRNNSLYALSCALFRYGVENHINILLSLNSGLSDSEINAIYLSADRSSIHNSVEFEKTVKTVTVKVKEYEINYAIMDYFDIYHIIKDVLKHKIRTNAITQRLELDGKDLTDQGEIQLYAELDRHVRGTGYTKKSPKKEIFYGAIAKFSMDEYNPIKEKLESINWDGISRVNSLCLCLKDKNNVASNYLYHFLLGSIERIYNTYQNPILVLDGKQKIGKSTFVNFLGSTFKRYFVADGSLDPENKDDRLALCQNFIYNWEEGASFGKRQMDAIKSLLFSESQRIRKPYARHDSEYKINASIIMPKNEGKFLTDVTGNRRYNIAELEVIDFSYANFDADQIWAEVYSLWQQDTAKSWKIIDEAKKEEINESMMITPALYDTLDETLEVDENSFVSNYDLFNELQRRDNKFDRNKMAKIIANYCYSKDFQKAKYKDKRGIKGCRLIVLPIHY